MGLPALEFREVGEFVVTFRMSQALAAPQPQPQYRETLWGEDERRATPVESLPDEQESRLVKALGYVNEHGFITNSLYRELTRVSDRTASRDLEALVERGRLKSVGKKGARRYTLP